MEVSKIDLNQNIDFIAPNNIFNSKGALLIPKDTVIDSKGIERLLRHGVEFIETMAVSREEIPPAYSTPVAEIASPTPYGVGDAESFKSFVNNYKEQEKAIETSLEAIRRNEGVNIDEIYQITEKLVKDVKNKKDVFAYMWFLQEYDNHTFCHSNNVSVLANIFGQWLKMSEAEIKQLTVAALLHDIGKLDVPNEIINKPSRLDPSEFSIVKAHTVQGYERLKSQNLPYEVQMAALMHHERIDGSGYPLGVTGDKIHKFAKIVAICDIYDAMCSKRSYKDKRCPFSVMRKLEVELIGHVDTELLLIFLKNIAQNYVGVWAKLTDGRNAEIMVINPANISRPIVRLENGEVISLTNGDLEISHII